MEREKWRSDPDWIATMGGLGFEAQWYACDCGAHWLEKYCGPECNHSHRQYPDWDLCNWPPEMLKYWDIWNWRARTAPVDYPQLPKDHLAPMLEVYKKRWPSAGTLGPTDKIWNREYESKFNHRTWSEPVDYFCPLELQQVNIVWLTPQQYQEIHKLALAMEAGTLSLSKGIAQMRQIHLGIQPNRHIQLVVKPALTTLEKIDHQNKIVYFNSTVEEPKS